MEMETIYADALKQLRPSAKIEERANYTEKSCTCSVPTSSSSREHQISGSPFVPFPGVLRRPFVDRESPVVTGLGWGRYSRA